MMRARCVFVLVTLCVVSACGSASGTDPIDAAAIDGRGTMCDPAVSATPVDDSCGVFVDAASGNDGNTPSTKASPLATLAAALDQVPAGGAVYACSGAALDGGVTVPPGVAIYGGLECGTWMYNAQQPTIVSAQPDVVALRLPSGAGATVLSDLYVQATSSASIGGSSIGLIAVGATASLRRVLVVTGDGAGGAPGVTPTGQGTTGQMGNAGSNGCGALSIPGGPMTSITCAMGTSTGGKGGDGAYYGYDGSTGTPGADNHGTGYGMSTAGCSNGGVGANGGVGGTGMPGSGRGAVSTQGYTGVAGGTGGVGAPGQGGGGGGGASSFGNCAVNTFGGASGGSGGTGGCGGMGGSGGQPGGASIGIVSINASLVFSDVAIQTGNGGEGGPGGDGQAGGPGGDGRGGGASPYPACAGGKGGTGGIGGTGGGGTGGHSLGIAYVGAAPPAAMVTFTLGSAGAGGGTGPATGDNGMAANTQAF